MRTRKERRLSLMSALGVVLVLVALLELGGALLDYRREAAFYEKVTARYVQPVRTPVAPENEAAPRFETVTVGLDALRRQNADIIGWLHFENGALDYPVLWSGDNARYLRRSYLGEPLTAGSIFLDGSGSPDLSDRHAILYGHDMHDLSMFGRLKYYKKSDYMAENRYFQLYLPERVERYEIVSCRVTDPYDDLYVTYHESDAAFAALAAEAPGAERADRIVTLSTCAGERDRLVVHAILIDSMTL